MYRLRKPRQDFKFLLNMMSPLWEVRSPAKYVYGAKDISNTTLFPGNCYIGAYRHPVDTLCYGGDTGEGKRCPVLRLGERHNGYIKYITDNVDKTIRQGSGVPFSEGHTSSEVIVYVTDKPWSKSANALRKYLKGFQNIRNMAGVKVLPVLLEGANAPELRAIASNRRAKVLRAQFASDLDENLTVKLAKRICQLRKRRRYRTTTPFST